jgi:hypothetical protein
MNPRFLGAVVVTLAAFGATPAEEIPVYIHKIEGGRVTYTRSAKKGVVNEPMTLPVVANPRVTQAKFDPETKKILAGEPIDGGLRNEVFTNFPAKGLRAYLVIDEGNRSVVEIRVLPVKKKGGA